MNNIEKLFVPYQEALDMKLLGFDEDCLAKFYFDYLELGGTWKNSDFESDSFYSSAPTYSQCFSWFRENYNIHTWIDSKKSDNLGDVRYFRFMPIFNLSNKINLETLGYYKTYEEAEQECLKQLIKKCKK